MNQNESVAQKTQNFPVKSLMVTFAEGLRLTGHRLGCQKFLAFRPRQASKLSWRSRLFLPWVKKANLQIAWNEEAL